MVKEWLAIYFKLHDKWKVNVRIVVNDWVVIRADKWGSGCFGALCTASPTGFDLNHAL